MPLDVGFKVFCKHQELELFWLLTAYKSSWKKTFPLSLFLIDLSTFRISFSYYFVFSAAFYNCCSLTICAISFSITKIRLARFDTIEKKNNIYSRTISFSWNETIRCLIGKGWESLIYGKTDIIIIIPAGHRWTTYIHNLIKSPFLDLSSLRNQTETLATQGPQGTAPTDHDSYKLRWVPEVFWRVQLSAVEEEP